MSSKGRPPQAPGRPGRSCFGLVEHGGGFGRLPLAQPDRRLQVPLQARRRLVEELGQPPFRVELLPRPLGAEQLPEHADPHGGLRVQFADGVELFVGALEIAGKAEQLRQKPRLPVSAGCRFTSSPAAAMASANWPDL